MVSCSRIGQRIHHTEGEDETSVSVFGQKPKDQKSFITKAVQENYNTVSDWKKQKEKERNQFAECYHDLGMVFYKQGGNYIYPREFLAQYQRLLKRAGLEKKRFHDLRHTVASFLINANEKPKVFQQLLGHSNISTTLDIYAHVMGDTMNKKSVDKLYEQLQLDSK